MYFSSYRFLQCQPHSFQDGAACSWGETGEPCVHAHSLLKVMEIKLCLVLRVLSVVYGVVYVRRTCCVYVNQNRAWCLTGVTARKSVFNPHVSVSEATMGLGLSKEGPCQEPERPESVISAKLHGRQASIRQSTIRAKSKQPMPDPSELERRFTKVLVSRVTFDDMNHILLDVLSVFIPLSSREHVWGTFFFTKLFRNVVSTHRSDKNGRSFSCLRDGREVDLRYQSVVPQGLEENINLWTSGGAVRVGSWFTSSANLLRFYSGSTNPHIDSTTMKSTPKTFVFYISAMIHSKVTWFLLWLLT